MSILKYESSTTTNGTPLWDVGFSDTVKFTLHAATSEAIPVPDNATHAIVSYSNSPVMVSPDPMLVIPEPTPSTSKDKIPNDVIYLKDGETKMTLLYVLSLSDDNVVTIQWLDLGANYL